MPGAAARRACGSQPRVSDPFAGLEPAAFWRHFAALTRIPRATFEEEQAVAYVTRWAGERSFEARRDAAGNLVVAVPATPGRESAPTVILQGHLDIVCERDPDSLYDPRAGRIDVVREGGWLRADGTTLGADNGVGVAAMLALVEGAGEDAGHGPLELLMTVAEEVGMAGAADLSPELIGGSVLLNLDSGHDGTLTVGCAGGIDTLLRLDAAREPVAPGDAALRVTVSGGRGGHSGGDIAAGSANAIGLLARILGAVPGLRIASLDGGASRNAIPRDAAAVLSVARSVQDATRTLVEDAGSRAAAAYRRSDPELRVSLDDARPNLADAWGVQASRRIIDLIATLPSGPLRMSTDFPGVVEASSSLGIAATDGARLTLHSLSRSAFDDVMPEITGAIAAAGRLAGAAVEPGRAYPGWRPDLHSPALATAKAVFERLFGEQPQVALTHGGLEPAIIGAKRPGLEMLSFGPQIEGAHAPGERLQIASAQRFTRLLAAFVDELSRG